MNTLQHSRPPRIHLASDWNEESRVLSYEYNGRKTLSIHIPGSSAVSYRVASDGDLLSRPFTQQIYVIVEGGETVTADAQFTLSPDAVCMRAQRAGENQAILGQVGKPCIPGVNGLYDIGQDMLIDWYGLPWQWKSEALVPNAQGDLTGNVAVELGLSAWIINVRPLYYREHLGFSYHAPWKWRPRTRPLSGWCSWEAYRRDIDQEKIEQAGAWAATHFRPYGLEIIQTDDGFQPPVIPENEKQSIPHAWLNPQPELFPHGHAGIVAAAKKQGLKAGIWVYTHVQHEGFARNNPGFIRDAQGNPLKGKWIGFVPDCLPETLDTYLRPTFEGMRAFGYEYLKTDGLRHLIYDGLHEAVRLGLISDDEAELRLRNYMECIREAIGPDTFYLSSFGVFNQVIGIADACRVGVDVNAGWPCQRMQAVEAARWFHTQRILFMNDPDHLTVRAELNWAHLNVSLVCLTGGLFMLSDAPAEYDPPRIDLVKKCLPPLETYTAETGPLPLFYPAYTWTKEHGADYKTMRDAKIQKKAPGIDSGQERQYATMNDDHPFGSLWAIHIHKPFRSWCVLSRCAITPLRESRLPFSSLGLNADTEYLAFDFWTQSFLGSFTGEFPCNRLPMGESQVVSLSAASGHPQLIASSRHVSMDAVSVTAQQWKDGQLRVEIEGVESTTCDYWIYVPAGFAVRAAQINAKSAQYELRGNVIKIPVSFNAGIATASLSVTFDRV